MQRRERRALAALQPTLCPHPHVITSSHVLFAGEKVRADYLLAAPDLTESEDAEYFRVLSLEALVRMKLTAFRRKDQVHVLDFIEVGLVDASWPARFMPELGARLQQLLDTPDG